LNALVRNQALDPPAALTLEQIYRACDPYSWLPAGSSRFADLSRGRGIRSVAEALSDALCQGSPDPAQDPYTPPAHQKILVTGPPGCGKTTDLRTAAARLERDGFFVVWVQAEETLDLEEPGWVELLLEMAQQVVAQGRARRRDNRCAPSTRTLTRAERWLDTTTMKRVTEVGNSLQAEGGVKAGGTEPWAPLTLLATFRALWNARSNQVREIRREMEPNAQRFAADLARFFGEFDAALRNRGRRGLVIIVDGLEKAGGPVRSSELQGQIDLFLTHAPQLHSPNCQVIYTVPEGLAAQLNLKEYYPQESTLRVPMVRVRDRTGQDHPEGIAALRRLVEQRVNVLVLFDSGALEQLARASGGHVRDLLYLIRIAAGFARRDGAPGIGIRHAEDAIRHMGIEVYQELAELHLESLRDVRSKQRLAPEHRHLVQDRLVLTYRDDDGYWCDVHPCVRGLPRLGLGP
jgi:hypothetical protein